MSHQYYTDQIAQVKPSSLMPSVANKSRKTVGKSLTNIIIKNVAGACVIKTALYKINTAKLCQTSNQSRALKRGRVSLLCVKKIVVHMERRATITFQPEESTEGTKDIEEQINYTKIPGRRENKLSHRKSG